MKDYHHKCSVSYDKPDRRGYTSLNVLSFLKGKKWDEVALAYVHSLRPSSIRVSKDEITLDARCWRVTVMVDENDIIKEISQEVEVGLPEGVAHGHALDHALHFGLDSKQVKWHLDAEATGYDCQSGEYWKIVNGKAILFPKEEK